MKKHLLPLLASVLLLGACDSNNLSSSENVSSKENESSVSGNESSSSESSISSEESSSSESSSSSEENEDYKALRALGEKLKYLSGQVNKANATIERVFSYSGQSLTVNVSDEEETIRYTRKETNTYVSETIGSENYEGEGESSYKKQKYDNGKKFFSVTKYEGQTATSSKSSFSSDEVENFYDIGPAGEEITNFNNIILLEKADAGKGFFEWSFENLEGIEENEYLKYSYTISQYETLQDGTKALSQQVRYENKFTIGDYITKLEQKYTLTTISSGLTDLANTLTATKTVTYTQGEFTEYSGTLINVK